MTEKSTQSPSFDKKRIRAEREFRRLVSRCLDPVTWDDWTRTGGFFEQQPKSLVRRRTVNIERLFPIVCFQELWPLHDDSAWPGPRLKMDSADAEVNWIMTINQTETAPFSSRWRSRRSTLAAERSRYTVAIDAGYRTEPVFPPHRVLTEEEIEDFLPYGGYQEIITAKRKDQPRDRYAVEDEDDALSIGWYSSNKAVGWPEVAPIQTQAKLDILIQLNDLIFSQTLDL